MIQALLYYLLESTLIMGVGLLLFYLYFSKRLTAPYARRYLLTFVTIAFLFPGINVPVLELSLPDIALVEETTIAEAEPTEKGEVTAGPIMAQEALAEFTQPVNPKAATVTGQHDTESSGIQWFIIYIGVSGFFVIITAFQFASFFRLVRRSESIDYHGHRILLSDDKGVSGLSLFGFIVISRKFYGEPIFDIILKHELAHQRLGHSRDLLVVRILSCIFWPNVLIHRVERELKRVHEYEADNYTSSSVEKDKYIKSLIALSVPSIRTYRVHSFARAHITGRVKQLTSPVLKVAKNVKYSLLIVIMLVFVASSCTQLSENAIPSPDKEKRYSKLRSVTTTYHSNQPDTRQKDDQIISKVEFSDTGEILLAETYMDYPYDYEEPQPIRLIGDVEKSDLLHTMDGLSLEAAGNPILYGARWPTLLMMKAEEGTHKYKHEYRQNVRVAIENHSDRLPKSIRYYEELDGVGAQWALDVKDIFKYDEQGRVIHHEVKSGVMYRNEYEKKTEFQYDNNGEISNVSNARNSFDITFDRKELSVFKKYLNDEVVNTRKYFYDENGLKTKTEVYNRYGDLEYTVFYKYDFFE